MEKEIIERAFGIAKTIQKLYRQLLKKEVKNEDIKNTEEYKNLQIALACENNIYKEIKPEEISKYVDKIKEMGYDFDLDFNDFIYLNFFMIPQYRVYSKLIFLEGSYAFNNENQSNNQKEKVNAYLHNKIYINTYCYFLHLYLSSLSLKDKEIFLQIKYNLMFTFPDFEQMEFMNKQNFTFQYLNIKNPTLWRQVENEILEFMINFLEDMKREDHAYFESKEFQRKRPILEFAIRSSYFLIHDSEYFKNSVNLLSKAIFENKHQGLNLVYIRILNAVDQDRIKK